MAEQMYKAGQLDPKIKANITRNRAEMFAYNMIATAMSPMDNLRRVCNLDLSEFNLEEKELIVEALRI